jgi:putative SOS response-associated peptidase YedK
LEGDQAQNAKQLYAIALKDGAPFVIADIWESVYNAANARRRQQNHSRRSPAEVAIFVRITGGSTYWERT